MIRLISVAAGVAAAWIPGLVCLASQGPGAGMGDAGFWMQHAAMLMVGILFAILVFGAIKLAMKPAVRSPKRISRRF